MDKPHFSMFLLTFFLGLIFLQCVLAGAGTEEWPSSVTSEDWDTKELEADQFQMYIAMYHNAGQYKLYRMDATKTTPLHGETDQVGGWPMKLWQATVEGKEYLVEFTNDAFFMYCGGTAAEKIEIKQSDGYKNVADPAQAFVLDHYIIVGTNTAYDMKEAAENGKVTELKIDGLKVNGKALPQKVKDLIKDKCFATDRFKKYCAQYVPGTTNYEEKMIGIVENNFESTLFYGDRDYLYAEHGQDIGLTENKRYYYIPWISEKIAKAVGYGDKGIIFYIKQDLKINDDKEPEGTRVMLFPFIQATDKFIWSTIVPPAERVPPTTTTTTTTTTVATTTTKRTTPPRKTKTNPTKTAAQTTTSTPPPAGETTTGSEEEDFGPGTFGGHLFLFKLMAMAFALLFLIK